MTCACMHIGFILNLVAPERDGLWTRMKLDTVFEILWVSNLKLLPLFFAVFNNIQGIESSLDQIVQYQFSSLACCIRDMKLKCK